MAGPIEIKCLQCGKSIKVKAEFAGKKGKCPVCGKIINIPDPSQKADTLGVNTDVSDAEVKKVAASIAAGTMRKQAKKKGFFARIFRRG
jgi:phage FluMu protein Com